MIIRILVILICLNFSFVFAQVIVDHSCTDVDLVPLEWIEKAKTDLYIAYGHTSHGSQLVYGMSGLIEFKGDLFSFNEGGTDGALDLRDKPFSGANDLGNPNRTAWEAATRTYLDANPDINVIIWSWCGQVSSASEQDINTYLNLMAGLEIDYPGVRFVYMTGHLDGSGLEGNLHLRNEQIRDYCRNNAKVLYDFADIETYNPDGVYFGDKRPNDNCDYDSDNNGTRDSNWAIEWQDAHPGEWYDCNAAHSQPLNGNLKAYAAWWLWARLAGWTGETTAVENIETMPMRYSLSQNYPNPFNPITTINYELPARSEGGPITNFVDLTIYNLLGQKVETLVSRKQKAGFYSIKWDASGLASGVYYYKIKAGAWQAVKKMILIQ